MNSLRKQALKELYKRRGRITSKSSIVEGAIQNMRDEAIRKLKLKPAKHAVHKKAKSKNRSMFNLEDFVKSYDRVLKES